MQLNYVFIVFNAKSNQGGPQLETQIALYRDGKALYNGAARPVAIKPQSDPRQIVASGTLTLGADFAPGEYSLQVAVNDKLAKKKQRTAEQWVNFEVIR